MAKSRGLGKGLDALFGEGASSGVSSIRISEIEPNPLQPRQVFEDDALLELSESIRQNGVISPITVRKTGDRYQIIAGERRWRACRMAGVSEIPALVLEKDDEQSFLLALVENLQREDLNPVEEAEGYKRLVQDFSLSHEQVAERVGKSRPTVANALRLLSLSEPVLELLRSGALSAGHARTLLPLTEETRQLKAAQKVLDEGLSVRETEKLVKKLLQDQDDRPQKGKDIHVADLEHTLSTGLGRKVSIAHGKKRGKLTIEYYGNDDLDALCRLLTGGK